MIYTDSVHLITDGDQEELHQFAQSIGLKREWYQDNPRHPHYDLTSPRMAHKAVQSGVKRVSKRQLVRIIRRSQQLPASMQGVDRLYY
jgi:hypothetical protein